jgi:hypothetical protein
MRRSHVPAALALLLAVVLLLVPTAADAHRLTIKQARAEVRALGNSLGASLEGVPGVIATIERVQVNRCRFIGRASSLHRHRAQCRLGLQFEFIQLDSAGHPLGEPVDRLCAWRVDVYFENAHARRPKTRRKLLGCEP